MSVVNFRRGASGSLLCDVEIPGVTQELSDEAREFYGGRYFIGESMTEECSNLLNSLFIAWLGMSGLDLEAVDKAALALLEIPDRHPDIDIVCKAALASQLMIGLCRQHCDPGTNTGAHELALRLLRLVGERK